MSAEENDLEIVKAAARSLGEHFDSVQIFVTRHEAYENDGTMNLAHGEGNWFTRYGQVMEWMTRQNERTRKFIREE